MCGLIVSTSEAAVRAGVAALHHRGPDSWAIVEHDGWWMGHTRLAVQDLSDAANQPMLCGDTMLVYNGELWNAEQLRSTHRTTGDTEVVGEWLNAGGDPARFDGQFVACWVRDGTLRFCRDRLGEVPGHYGWTTDGHFVLASELKALRAASISPSTAAWVPPGVTGTMTSEGLSWCEWGSLAGNETNTEDTFDTARDMIDKLLAAAVHKRATISDVPVAALASGGIDSSAVIWHMLQHQPVVAYTAVLHPNSRDLRCARQLADALDITLVEVPVEPPTADDLSHVIEVIEMPHKAQIEIGWLCLALADRIAADGFKVLLSGEGSDELWASYSHAYHGIKKRGYRGYRAWAVSNQHRKNWARVNKIFMACGIEGRLPFADQDLVAYGLALPESSVGYRTRKNNPSSYLEKGSLRDAYIDRLPSEIVGRPKAAFQKDARIEDHITLADPTRYYRAEFRRIYQGVKP